MSAASALFNLCSVRDSSRKALVSLKRSAAICSLDELVEFYKQRAIEDANWLTSELGIQLQNDDASPSAYQGGSGKRSQPIVQQPPSVGAEGKEPVRLEGKPLKAKKSSKDALSFVTAASQPDAGSDSPSKSASVSKSKGK